MASLYTAVTYRDNTYMSPDPSTGFRFLPLFFPRTPQPSCTFPPLFYQLPLSFYQLPLLFRSFSHASATYCIASASEHVSRGSVHFRLHYWAFRSLPLDFLPFIHPYICLYISPASMYVFLSLNINYRPPLLCLSASANFLPLPTSEIRAQRTTRAQHTSWSRALSRFPF